MRIPKRNSEQNRLASLKQDNFLTAEAVTKLKRNLETIEQFDRPKAVEDLRQAREMGDLSENAAYSEAKGRLARLDGRIFQIKERLKYAVIIETGSENGIIGIGSTVTIEVNHETKTYQILGSSETNPQKGRISYLSPLGKLLVGHKSGDSVTLQTPAKEVVYKIIEVE